MNEINFTPISPYMRRKHDAWVRYVQEVRGYQWYACTYENRSWYWCFSMPDGNQRFCRNMPEWAQRELGIKEEDIVPGWDDPCRREVER
jgi:hypothetical protein